MTKTSKQRSVRFGEDLERRLEEMAEREGRTFSQQVTWLLRQSLATKSLQQPKQPAQPAAA